jgi:uncharacterized glyoxalase superfamily protein PhnB
MRFHAAVPLLRIFDLAKAREFYVDFLGFTWAWEHRFEPDLPAYVQVDRDGLVLHLSEHFGDASPGASLRIRVEGIEALHAALTAKAHRHARPGLETMPWGERAVIVTDPFHNRLYFYEEGAG